MFGSIAQSLSTKRADYSDPFKVSSIREKGRGQWTINSFWEFSLKSHENQIYPEYLKKILKFIGLYELDISKWESVLRRKASTYKRG